MQNKVSKKVKNASATGVTIATLLALLGFSSEESLDLIHLSVAWACSVVSLRYFVRASYTFSSMRVKCFKLVGNDFKSWLFISHSILIFFTCVNTAILNNLSLKLVIISFTIQSILLIIQWFLSFSTIFHKKFFEILSEEKIKRRYRVSHGLTIFLDILTMILSGFFIAMVFTDASVKIVDTLFLGAFLFIMVIVEGALHWWTEKEWFFNNNATSVT